MSAIARLSVRGMRDRRRVLVFAPAAGPRAQAMLKLREALSASLERASALLPGTCAEPVALRAEPALDGDGAGPDPMRLSGAVRSPTRLRPSEMRAFADVVARLLAADGYEISEPIVVEEGPSEH